MNDAKGIPKQMQNVHLEWFAQTHILDTEGFSVSLNK